MPTILRETYPTAKKEHRCEFCCEKIAIGQKYVRQTNVYDGTIYDFVTHQECKEVAHGKNLKRRINYGRKICNIGYFQVADRERIQ